MIVSKKGYKRRYAYGGSGIFETVVSNLLPFLGEVGKEVAKKQSVDIGNRLATKALEKIIPGKKITPEKKIENIIQKYERIPTSTLIDGSGVIPIQDLVRKLKI